MSKTVNIFTPGQGVDAHDNLYQLTIHPGTTVNQALEDAGLPGYMLRTETGSMFGSDNLYQQVDSGTKLVAILPMQVG